VFHNPILFLTFRIHDCPKLLSFHYFVDTDILKSQYRGVHLQSTTGRWKATIKIEGKFYDLGSYDDETIAARIFDVVYICGRGIEDAVLNFSLSDYKVQSLLEEPLEPLVQRLRAESVSHIAAKQTSTFHGVRLKKDTNKWESSIRVGGRQLSLGLYETDIEAARAHDQAAILRYMQGVGPMGVATSPPPLNFDRDHYAPLLDENEPPHGQDCENGDPPVEFLRVRYIGAVLDSCKEYMDSLQHPQLQTSDIAESDTATCFADGTSSTDTEGASL